MACAPNEPTPLSAPRGHFGGSGALDLPICWQTGWLDVMPPP